MIRQWSALRGGETTTDLGCFFGFGDIVVGPFKDPIQMDSGPMRGAWLGIALWEAQHSYPVGETIPHQEENDSPAPRFYLMVRDQGGIDSLRRALDYTEARLRGEDPNTNGVMS